MENKKSSYEVMFYNPKRESFWDIYKNCKTCDKGRVPIDETMCIDCWETNIVCVGKGCNKKVNRIGIRCNDCRIRDEVIKCENIDCNETCFNVSRYRFCKKHM
jgi:hypothetical protein